MNAIEFTNVWKKFKKGEKFNSLRDSIPAFFNRVARQKNDDLQEQEFWAVKDVNFTIKQGDVVGIMGPNGAGKSTILKLLSRIIFPNKGTMKINGKLSALIEVTAGFHPELTGRENVYLNGTILGMKKKEIDAKFDEIVEFSGISEFIDTPVKRYSSGMYSRLGFSVAAHMDPDILLVDEVLAVGDIAFQAKCAQKMRELLGSGATIVLVSHQLNLIQSLCRRVILLNQGEVLKDGPTDEVIPHYQNIVYRKSEEELKRKIASSDQVKVNTRSLVQIDDVRFFNAAGEVKDKFSINDTIDIVVRYDASERIESPIFLLEIVRADGVLCCCSRTDDAGLTVADIEGQGTFKMGLGKTNLAPGIYSAKISIWDKDMIHPYVIRNKDLIRIEASGQNHHTTAVFLPPVSWSIGKP